MLAPKSLSEFYPIPSKVEEGECSRSSPPYCLCPSLPTTPFSYHPTSFLPLRAWSGVIDSQFSFQDKMCVSTHPQ